MRPPKEKKLPIIRSQEEVRQILGYVHQFRYRVYLSTIYACGLRIGEEISLRIADKDSARMLVHVRKGKEAKDRYLPLSQHTLEQLRRCWVSHRNPA